MRKEPKTIYKPGKQVNQAKKEKQKKSEKKDKKRNPSKNYLEFIKRNRNPLVQELYIMKTELTRYTEHYHGLETYYVQLRKLQNEISHILTSLECGIPPIITYFENRVIEKIDKSIDSIFREESENDYDDFMKVKFMFHLAQLLKEIYTEIVKVESFIF